MTSDTKSRKSNSRKPTSQSSPSPSSNGALSTPQIKSTRQNRQSAERGTSANSNGKLKIYSDEEKIPSLASEKFPTLIGGGAVIGILRGVDEQSKKVEIFLSESDVTFYKLLPGTLVSVSFQICKALVAIWCLLDIFMRRFFFWQVSVASSEKRGLPLCSLAKECARRFGFGYDHEFADAAGSYFVIATLSCSTKV